MKRTLSILLAVVMLIGIIPFSAFALTPVSSISLDYDDTKAFLNTAYTEREAHLLMRKAVSTDTPGCIINTLNTFLMYSSNWYGIGQGLNPVSTETDYGIEFSVELDDEYEWIDSVMNLSKKTEITSVEGFSVSVNGVNRTDVLLECSTSNMLRIYLPIGKGSDAPIITGLSIDGANISMAIGQSKAFTATVTGTAPDKSVIWSVEGAESPATQISSDGNLTIADDESATSLTVKATSNFDSNCFDTKTVTVLKEIPVIETVTVSPATCTVAQYSEKIFSVRVQGTQTDKTVTWSVEGATSAKTSIDSRGILSVGIDEEATTLTVKAVSNADNTKFGTATVTVTKLERVSAVSIKYDTNAVNLTEGVLEKDVNTAIKDNISVETQGASVDKSNSYLMYKDADHVNWHAVGGEDTVCASKTYCMRCNIKLSDGYAWIDEVVSIVGTVTASNCPAFSISINGKAVTDVEIAYNSSYDSVNVYFIIPVHVHSYTDVVTAPTCTAKGYTTHTCACGDSYKDTYVNALGHKWDSGKVTKKATPTATGIKTYTCKVCKAKKTEKIAKCAKYKNTLSVKGKKVTVKYSKLKKSYQILSRNSVLSVTKAKGTLSYSKVSGNKNIGISKSTGMIRVKKGLKKGTYKIVVKATAAGNASYKSATKKATITIVVK